MKKRCFDAFSLTSLPRSSTGFWYLSEVGRNFKTFIKQNWPDNSPENCECVQPNSIIKCNNDNNNDNNTKTNNNNKLKLWKSLFSLPNILLSSALWRSGFWTASRLRSSLAHTMNAFMGRLIRGSGTLSTGVRCGPCPSGTSPSPGGHSKDSGHDEYALMRAAICALCPLSTQDALLTLCSKSLALW